MRNVSATVIAAAAMALALPAQDGRPGDSAVDLVIQRLSDPSSAKADAAMRSLIRGGTVSAKVLREALDRCRDPAFVERARRALAFCEVDAPPVGGLKLGLFADREQVEPGDKVRFTARLCNVSDGEIVVYTGMSYSGNVFENGLALQRMVDGEAVQARFGAVGFCGTGAYPLTVKLEPWSFHEFSFQTTCRTGRSGNQSIPFEGPRLERGYVFLEVGESPSQVRLRLGHEVRLDGVGGMEEPEHEPNWQGEVVSNEVVLRIAGD